MTKTKTSRNFNVRELSKVFAKYDFFSENTMNKDMEIYGVLLEVYSALGCDAKDELRWSYDIFKRNG